MHTKTLAIIVAASLWCGFADTRAALATPASTEPAAASAMVASLPPASIRSGREVYETSSGTEVRIWRDGRPADHLDSETTYRCWGNTLQPVKAGEPGDADCGLPKK